MVCRPIWVVHIKQCRQARVWLLRNLSAKKINKPFDHKGPIHSLTLRLTLSFSLPHPPSPHSTSPWSFLLGRLYRSLLFLDPFLDPYRLSFLLLKEKKEQQVTTWWARGQRDGRPSGQAGAQGLLYFTGTGTWHGKFPHHSTELDQGLQHNPPPIKIFCHAHASCLISNKRAFVRVFSYACECSWCEKAIPSHYPSVLTVCCSLSGCGSITICPLRPIFHFQNTADFLREKQAWTETSRQQAWKTLQRHYTPQNVKVYI